MSGCLSLEELERIASGQEDGPGRDLAGHLEECASCRERLDDVRRNLQLFDAYLASDSDFLQRSLRTTPCESESGNGASDLGEPTGALPVIDGYELLEEIHRGAQGAVYKAVQTSTKRTVGIKVLLHGLYASHRQKRRFEREIDLVAELEHPNIVRLYDSGRANGRHYFVMHYIEGLPLCDYMTVSRPGVEKTLILFVKICQAVAYAHARGILHRDLKPSNILVSSAGEPYILDFGLAKPIDATITGPDSLTTRPGEFFGTLAYASPEQASCNPDAVDTRSDVYALGVILYELLTGRGPYPTTGSMSEVLRHIEETEPARASHHNARVSSELDTIIRKALEKDPDRRYQSVHAFAADIERYLDGRPILAKPPSSLYTFRKLISRHKGITALTATLLVSLMGFAAVTTVYARLFLRQRDRAVSAERRARAEAEALERSLYFNRINLAFSAFEGRDTARMKQMLEACPESLRAWEWRRLKWLSDQSLVTFRGLTDDVLVPLRVSADGRWVATPGRDRTLRAWEPSTGREVLAIGEVDPGCMTGFSPDGNKLAVPGGEGFVGVWEIPTGVERMRLAHAGARRASFSPDGRRVVSSDAEAARVWDALDGHLIAELPGTCGEFSPEGGYLLAYRSGERSVCEVSSGKVVIRINSLGAAPAAIMFSRGDQGVLACCSDGMTRVWSLPSGEVVHALPHRGAKSVSEEVGGTRIVTYDDTAIKIWDAGAGKCITTIDCGAKGPSYSPSPGGKYAVLATPQSTRVFDLGDGRLILTTAGSQQREREFRFSPDGTRFLCRDRQGAIAVWGLPSGTLELKLPRHKAMAYEYSTDAARIVTGSREAIRLWDASDGRELLKIPVEDFHQFVATGLSPDGKRIVTCHNDDLTIIEHDARTGKHLLTRRNPYPWLRIAGWGQRDVRRLDAVAAVFDGDTGKTELLRGHVGSIRQHLHVPGGKRFVTASDDDTCKIWSYDSVGEALRWRLSGGLRSAAFSPDGERIATISSDGELASWEAARVGEPLWQIRAHEGSDTSSLDFSPDGTLLVTAPADVNKADTSPRVWESGTGRAVRVLTGHTQGVSCIRFLPDGKRIVSAGWDGTVRLWDAMTGKEISSHAQRGEVWDLAVSGDGRLIASGGQEGVVYLWDVGQGVVRARLEGHTNDIDALAFSPDGRKLVSGDNDGTLICWEVATGQPCWTQHTRNAKNYAAVFTPDGRRVLTGHKHRINIWEADSGSLVAGWRAHDGSIYSLDLTSDGRYLLSASGFGFTVWPAWGARSASVALEATTRSQETRD
ncbi:MAG: protein kinase [Phycisphaerae bacterium]|nr:protein kinase [Phycisphaerae bacterium]